MAKYKLNSDGSILTQGQVRALNKHISLPKVWTQDTCDALGITPITETPKPQPSSDVVTVVIDGTTTDANGNTIYNYVERPMFQTDENGTQAEKETAYRAEQLAKALETKIEALDTLADEKEQADLDMGGGLIVSMKEKDRLKLVNGLSLFGRKPGETRKTRIKGGFVDINKNTAEAIQDAYDTRLTAITTQHETHFNALNTLTTAQEVNDYDIETGNW